MRRPKTDALILALVLGLGVAEAVAVAVGALFEIANEYGVDLRGPID